MLLTSNHLSDSTTAQMVAWPLCSASEMALVLHIVASLARWRKSMIKALVAATYECTCALLLGMKVREKSTRHDKASDHPRYSEKVTNEQLLHRRSHDKHSIIVCAESKPRM